MTWYYDGEAVTSIEHFPDGVIGFVYALILEDGTKYIGKKNIYSKATLPALKSGKQRPNSTRIGRNIKGKRVYFDVVQKESNWKDYESSSKDIEGLKVIQKHILVYAKSSRELTYLETKMLFCYEVLEDELYRNANILGRFYKGNIK